MYRVYLRTPDQYVDPASKTITQSKQAALDAFYEAVNRTDLDGQKIAAVLSYKNKQLAFHRFDRQPGQVDYWRDKLDDIPLPQVGKPASLEGGRAIKVYLDAESIHMAEELGNGNVSEGIRIALKQNK